MSSGRRRSSSAWIGTVSAARITASQTSACRHPCDSTSSAASGMKTTLAKPPRKVSTVSARARKRTNQLATTANAGSYNTAAIARPIRTATA